MLQWALLVVAVAWTAPLRVILRADIGKKTNLVAHVFLYGFRMRFDGMIGPGGSVALHRENGEGEIKAPVRKVLQFARRFLRGVDVRSLSVDCCIGTGDACSTALLSSALSAFFLFLRARFGARVRVRTEYTRAFVAINVRCILFFRVGDIMLAGLRSLASKPLDEKKEGNANGSASH